MKNTIFFILFLYSFPLNAQKDSLKVGDYAPKISITDWIQNVPKDKSLNNKFIVLEFWTTWCGPCIGAVPHLNKLQTEFKSQNDLYFVSISNEKVDKIERLLKRVDFKSIVVTDQDKQTWRAFGNNKDGSMPIPVTILIDKNNKVKWIGQPNDLDKEKMTRFISNQDVETDKTVVVKSMDIRTEMINEVKSGGNANKFTMTLAKPNAMITSSQLLTKGLYMHSAVSVVDLLSLLYRSSANLMDIPQNMISQKYKVVFRDLNIKNEEEAKKVLKDSVLQVLNLDYKTVVKNTETYIFNVKDKSKLEVSVAEFSSFSYDQTNQQYIFTSSTFADILKNIEKDMKILIQDETQLKEKYDMIVKMSSIDDMIKSLESYGIAVKKVMKEQTYHVFDNKK